MTITRKLFLVAALIGLALAPVDRWILPSEVASAQGVPPQSGGKVPSDFDILRQGITAGTTQTQAGATLLTGTLNEVTTGSTGDGVALPLCAAGSGPPKRITVLNGTGAAIKVYGTSPDTINGVATATGVSLPVPSGTLTTGPADIEFVCGSVVSGVGRWYAQ